MFDLGVAELLVSVGAALFSAIVSYFLAIRKRAVQARLQSKSRKTRNRRISIIGAVVEAHAQHDAQFADYLWTILKNRVTREADREFLGLPPKSKF